MADICILLVPSSVPAHQCRRRHDGTLDWHWSASRLSRQSQPAGVVL